MRFILLTILLIAAAWGTNLAKAQTKSSQKQDKSQIALRASEYPQLSEDYKRSAEFKLASRKKPYHIGEVISLSMAMRNTANESLYFLEMPYFLDIHVFDAKGREVEVHP